MTTLPYTERRALLVGLRLGGPAWWTLPSWTGVDPYEVLAACEVHDIECVMAKAPASPYRPGRHSPEWVKLKTPSWRLVHSPHRRKAPKHVSLPA